MSQSPPVRSPKVRRPKGGCTTSLKDVHEDLYDIIEKKMIADVADEAKGNATDSLPQYVTDYYTNKVVCISRHAQRSSSERGQVHT